MALWGSPVILWSPEIERVSRVVLKNARGHIFHALDEPVLSEPVCVGICPLTLLSDGQREAFEEVPNWAEVGSNALELMAKNWPEAEGWINVQSGVYRYTIDQTLERLTVRTVLHEYLATEVSWKACTGQKLE